MPSPWSNGAVLAVHGSWDRQPPQTPAVLWMAWDGATETLMPAITLVDGFQESNGSRWAARSTRFRDPTGASDAGARNTAGAVYRLTPPTS